VQFPKISAREILIAVALIVVVMTIYGRTAQFEFLNYDDNLYVTGCVQTRNGLNWDNVGWAFTTGAASNWHPLTWLSYMLDVSLFGDKPGPMHLENAVWHAVNSVLLFLLLRMTTGAMGRSAFVAALFALHPLHVESVAWIAERKDVLSTFFWFLTTLAYVQYVRRPGVVRYLLVLLPYGLGLLAKPMLVTLPATLMLLDLWPLGRYESAEKWPLRAVRLFVEKLPLFILAAASSVATIIAQHGGKSMTTLDVLPFAQRLANASISYVVYLVKTAWPANLAPFYPHPGPAISYPTAALCAFLLLSATIAVLVVIRRAPYVAVGWLWYLGTLLPVIGIIQVGAQAMADRYTYVPLIGIFMVIAWGGYDLVIAFTPPRRKIAAQWAIKGMALLVLHVFGIAAVVQTRHWSDSISLFRHTLRVTKNNHLAHKNLGVALADKKHFKEAMEEYVKAIRIKPNDPDLYYNMANALSELQRSEEAVEYYRKAIEINADHLNAHYNLGNTLAHMGRFGEAAAQYRETLRIEPNHTGALVNMGNTMAMNKHLDEAEKYYQQALRLEPGNQESLSNLGNVYAEQGRTGEAIAQYRRAVQNDPRDVQSYNNMAQTLIKAGRFTEAAEALDHVVRLDPGNAAAREMARKLRESDRPPPAASP